MDEALVRELVARILADPRLQAMLAPAPPAAAAIRPKALIVVENQAGLQALPELQQRWDSCCSLQVCVSGLAPAAAATLPQISHEQAMAESGWSRILAPVCSGRQLAHIALGVRQDTLADIIGQAILQGIPVEIGRVDFGFTDRTPAAYRRLLEGYLAQAAAYGVTVGAAAVLRQPASQAPVAPADSPAPAAASPAGPEAAAAPAGQADTAYDRKLMTEKEAVLLPEHAVLRLTRLTVLTPSAIDVLKSRKVTVYREGARYL